MEKFFQLLQRWHGLFVLGAMVLGMANAAWFQCYFSNQMVSAVVICLVVFPALADIFNYSDKIFAARGRLLLWTLIINLVLSPLLALAVAKVFWRPGAHEGSGLILMSVMPASALVLPLIRRRGGALPMLIGLVLTGMLAAAFVGLPLLVPRLSADHLQFDTARLIRGIAVIFFLPLAAAVLLKYVALRRLGAQRYHQRVEPWVRRTMALGTIAAGFAVMSLPYDVTPMLKPVWWLRTLGPVFVYLTALAVISAAISLWYYRKGVIAGPQGLSFALAMASRNVNVCIGLVLSSLYNIEALMVLPPLFVAYALQAGLMPLLAGYLAKRLKVEQSRV